MKTIEQFYAEVKDNKELQQAFQATVGGGTVEAFLKEQQVGATLEELEAYGKPKSGELADEDLEAVAGGELVWGSKGMVSRSEDVCFEFNIGDRVEVYYGWIFQTITKRGTVTERKVEQSSGGYRPIYHVVFDKWHAAGRGGCYKDTWADQDDLSY